MRDCCNFSKTRHCPVVFLSTISDHGRTVEVGCRGFIETSIQRLLKNVGVTGPKLKKASKDLAEEAEKASFWLWLRRKDMVWGKQGSKGCPYRCSTTVRRTGINGVKHHLAFGYIVDSATHLWVYFRHITISSNISAWHVRGTDYFHVVIL